MPTTARPSGEPRPLEAIDATDLDVPELLAGRDGLDAFESLHTLLTEIETASRRAVKEADQRLAKMAADLEAARKGEKAATEKIEALKKLLSGA